MGRAVELDVDRGNGARIVADPAVEIEPESSVVWLPLIVAIGDSVEVGIASVLVEVGLGGGGVAGAEMMRRKVGSAEGAEAVRGEPGVGAFQVKGVVAGRDEADGVVLLNL